MEYALLDWDNTLRKGYTLFSLIDFFVENNVIDKMSQSLIKKYYIMYLNNSLSHDGLAEKCCDIFAESLKGKNKATITSIIDEFIEEDKKSMFIFFDTILSVLNENNIKPIIISGAPKDIIERYSDLGIYKIYAFELEVNNDLYTGSILSNYGYEKGKCVKDIAEMMQQTPILSFGDSESDYEMFKIAKRSIIVCADQKEPIFEADGIIRHNSAAIFVKEMIQKNINIARHM